jgi:hypothetical protein
MPFEETKMDQEASCQEAGDEVALAQLLSVREEDLLHVIEEKLDDYDFPSAEGEGEGERQKSREQKERLWRESLKWEVLDEVRSEVELIKLELLVEVKNEMRRGLAQLVRDSCTNTTQEGAKPRRAERH